MDGGGVECRKSETGVAHAEEVPKVTSFASGIRAVTVDLIVQRKAQGDTKHRGVRGVSVEYRSRQTCMRNDPNAAYLVHKVRLGKCAAPTFGAPSSHPNRLRASERSERTTHKTKTSSAEIHFFNMRRESSR